MTKTKKLRKAIPFQTDVVPTIFKARLSEPDPEFGKYQVTVLVDDELRKSLEEMLEEAGTANFGADAPEFKGFKENDEGQTFLKFDTNYQPTVVDSQGMPIAPSDIPPLNGGQVRIQGTCKAYFKPSKGLKFYLQGVQIVEASGAVSFGAVEGGTFKASNKAAPVQDNAAVEGDDLDDDLPF